jgi:hypothetical protein
MYGASRLVKQHLWCLDAPSVAKLALQGRRKLPKAPALTLGSLALVPALRVDEHEHWREGS